MDASSVSFHVKLFFFFSFSFSFLPYTFLFVSSFLLDFSSPLFFFFFPSMHVCAQEDGVFFSISILLDGSIG